MVCLLVNTSGKNPSCVIFLLQYDMTLSISFHFLRIIVDGRLVMGRTLTYGLTIGWKKNKDLHIVWIFNLYKLLRSIQLSNTSIRIFLMGLFLLPPQFFEDILNINLSFDNVIADKPICTRSPNNDISFNDAYNCIMKDHIESYWEKFIWHPYTPPA